MSLSLHIQGPERRDIHVEDLARLTRGVAEDLSGGQPALKFDMQFFRDQGGVFSVDGPTLGFYESTVLKAGGYLVAAYSPDDGPDRQFRVSVHELSRDDPNEVFLATSIAIAIAKLIGANYIEDPTWTLCVGGDAVKVADLMALGKTPVKDFPSGVRNFMAELPLQGCDL